jgi:hypothetical protein
MAFASREAFEGIGSLGPEGPSEVDELANRQRAFPLTTEQSSIAMRAREPA